ncbi:hypothetical protein JCM19233_6914 [Vibrio astriarenae]|nr:hypothetical protein JCM19233_6914 [Vibrio sp. C7]
MEVTGNQQAGWTVAYDVHWKAKSKTNETTMSSYAKSSK